jgi:hypothetical protein
VRAYVITTGTVFALVFVAHLARLFLEGGPVARDPVFLALTALAAGLSAWAWRVLGALPKT